MKIADARVIVTCPGRNFVTLKLVTDDGVTGVGDATLTGREIAVASYLTEHVVPLLIGREADRIEDTWQYLYRGAYWRRGPVTMSAIAAVDTALWDIKAKLAGMPLYQLLGGASRTGVMVCSAWKSSPRGCSRRSTGPASPPNSYPWHSCGLLAAPPRWPTIWPSIWPEPFGRIFVEAASNGIPSIASRRGGIRHVCSPSDGSPPPWMPRRRPCAGVPATMMRRRGTTPTRPARTP